MFSQLDTWLWLDIFRRWFSLESDWDIFRRSNLQAEPDHSDGGWVTDEYERARRTCKIEYQLAVWAFFRKRPTVFS